MELGHIELVNVALERFDEVDLLSAQASEISLKGCVVELSTGQVDVHLNLFALIIRSCELSFANKGRVSVASLRKWEKGHTGSLTDDVAVKVDGGVDLRRGANDLVVDVNLIFDADAGVLTKTLDTVGDLTAKTLALELGSKMSVKHDSGGALGLTCPLFVALNSLGEGLDDLEHTLGNLVSVDIHDTVSKVSLDLIIGQLGKCSLEGFIELLAKGLSESSVVSFDSVLNKLVFVLLKNKVDAVDFVLDVLLELGVAVEHLLVGVDKLKLSKRVLHADDGAASEKTTDLDRVLHRLDSGLDVVVNEIITVAWDVSKVNGGLVVRVILTKSIAEVLEEVLGDEGCDRSHKLSSAQDDVKADGKSCSLVLDRCLTLHAVSVESDVPVSEVLKESDQVANDVVQPVVVHLVTDVFDHVLGGSDNPLVEVVGSLAVENLCAHLWVEQERLTSSRLETSDVLDAETVGIEPGKEDVTDNILDSFF